MSSIPLVDLTNYAVGTSQQTDAHDDAVRDLATQLVTSQEKFGIVYLINHGIPQEQITSSLSIYRQFFESPVDEKERCRKPSNIFTGWTGLQEESLVKGKPADYHEGFGTRKHELIHCPDAADFPKFTQTIKYMIFAMEDLSTRLLRLLAIGLNYQDTDIFLKHHNFDQKKNPSNLRLNYYPPLNDHKVKSEQMRFGDHSDGTTITLLYHNERPGYELKLSSGEFMSVSPMPTAIMMNAGDFLQRWTTDKIVSPVHHVKMPTGEEDATRLSVAYYVIPDADKLIECLDGSNKYPAVYSMEYNYAKFAEGMDFNKSFLKEFQ